MRSMMTTSLVGINIILRNFTDVLLMLSRSSVIIQKFTHTLGKHDLPLFCKCHIMMKRSQMQCLSPLLAVLFLANLSSGRLSATNNWTTTESTQIIITNERQLVSDDEHMLCQSGIISNDGGVCCDASCGTCGEAGCGNRPGGESGCCTSNIVASGVVCSEETDTRCNTLLGNNSTDKGDWASSWDTPRVLLSSGKTDPYDSRSTKVSSNNFQMHKKYSLMTVAGTERLSSLVCFAAWIWIDRN